MCATLKSMIRRESSVPVCLKPVIDHKKAGCQGTEDGATKDSAGASSKTGDSQVIAWQTTRGC